MHTVLVSLLSRYPQLGGCLPGIERAYETIVASFREGGKLLICGNGGSAADSEHIVGELMKGFASRRPLPADVRSQLAEAFGEDGRYLAERLQGALPAISLVSHTSLNTAFANDVAADLIFAQQVYGYGRPGDVLLGISTSGNARNVCYALQIARFLGLHTVGLTGPGGGAMAALCDVPICAPGERTPEIQEHHLPIYHALCEMLEEAFFGQ
jgi:D-sedoheptulose 7-phosphate isomerase